MALAPDGAAFALPDLALAEDALEVKASGLTVHVAGVELESAFLFAASVADVEPALLFVADFAGAVFAALLCARAAGMNRTQSNALIKLRTIRMINLASKELVAFDATGNNCRTPDSALIDLLWICGLRESICQGSRKLAEFVSMVYRRLRQEVMTFLYNRNYHGNLHMLPPSGCP